MKISIIKNSRVKIYILKKWDSIHKLENSYPIKTMTLSKIILRVQTLVLYWCYNCIINILNVWRLITGHSDTMRLERGQTRSLTFLLRRVVKSRQPTVTILLVNGELISDIPWPHNNNIFYNPIAVLLLSDL